MSDLVGSLPLQQPLPAPERAVVTVGDPPPDTPADPPPPSPFFNRIAGMDVPAELKEWVAATGQDTTDAWANCYRADWMVRLLIAARIDPRRITKIALEVAADVVPLVPSGVAQVRNALACAGNWALGMAPIEQVRLAIRQAHEGNPHSQSLPFYACAAAAHSCVHSADAGNAVYAAAESQAQFGLKSRTMPAAALTELYLAQYANIVRKHVSAVDVGTALGL